MIVFNLWYPSRLGSRQVAFDLTRAEAATIRKGTEDLVQSCLAALGVEAPVASWSVRPCRCSTYSDYPEHDQVEDRWPLCWQMLVVLSRQVEGPLPEDTHLPIPVPEFDATAGYEFQDPGHDGRLLWQCWFEDEERADEMMVEVRTALATVAEEVDREIRPLGGGALARVTVEGSREDLVPRLEALSERARRSGAMTRWPEISEALTSPPARTGPADERIETLARLVAEPDLLRLRLATPVREIFGDVSGGRMVAERARSGETEEVARLFSLLDELLLDDDPAVRTGVLEVHRLAPRSGDGEALRRAFLGAGGHFAGVAPVPQVFGRDLEHLLAVALGERAEAGDEAAGEALRDSALEGRRIDAVLPVLQLLDGDWLFWHAVDVGRRTPRVSGLLLHFALEAGRDAADLGRRLRQHLSREQLQEAVDQLGDEARQGVSALLRETEEGDGDGGGGE